MFNPVVSHGVIGRQLLPRGNRLARDHIVRPRFIAAEATIGIAAMVDFMNNCYVPRISKDVTPDPGGKFAKRFDPFITISYTRRS